MKPRGHVVIVPLEPKDASRLEDAAVVLGVSRVDAARRFLLDGISRILGGLGA